MNKELYLKPKSKETEIIIKTNVEDMENNNFITISGFKGYQFNNEVFIAMLKFKDLKDFLTVFENVQREVSTRKVKSIKRYIVSGIQKNVNLRFFPSLTVTSRGSIFYDEQSRKIAIDTHNSKLSINDGQHRFYGIEAAIAEFVTLINKSKIEEEKVAYEEMIDRLKNMTIPLTIFNNLSEEQEKQLFYDLNTLAQRPSKSSTIKLAQTDIIAKLAREISNNNEYLKRYGVEMNKTSIHKNNENTILLTTVYAMIKNLFKTELKHNPDYLNEREHDEIFLFVNGVMNDIFSSLPKDINIKNKYIIDKSYILRGIATFYYNKLASDVKVKHIKQAIKNVNWLNDIEVWRKYGGYTTNSGIIQFAGSSEGGIRVVQMACDEQLNKLVK